jgi:transposase
MNRLEISDQEWEKIGPILAAHRHVRMRSEERCRLFVTAVLWILRSGAPWRVLPAEYGHWNSVFKRFSRWCRHAVWIDLHRACIHCPDLENISIDSTIVRAHPCAAGAAGSTADAEALGRSRGGFTTKIHATVEALGLPLDFELTGGQASDIGQADTLLARIPEGAGALVGDKGYDSDDFVQAVEAKRMAVVIPPRSHRKTPRTVDWFVYKERHVVECFFNKIKHYRRIFSRFEKLARNYMGMLRFVSALVWLR